MIRAIVRWRWAGLGVLIVLVLSVTPGMEHAAVPDNSLTVWFLESDPQLDAYYRFQDHFGNDEVILLQVEEPLGLFRSETLSRLSKLVHRIESIDGVERVESLLSARDFIDGEEGLRFDRVVPEPVPGDPEPLAAARDEIRNSILFRGRLVDDECTRAMLWIQMEAMEDFDLHRDEIVAAVRRAADEVLGSTPHPMGGVGVIYSGLNLITQRDFAVFVGLGYTIMFLAMWWMFRSMRLVLAAIGVILLANLATLGIYGLAGNRLNMVTVMLPTLVLVLGLADAVHFPVAFVHEAQLAPELSRGAAAERGLRMVLFPCAFNTGTTMAGFLSLATAPMAVIRHLGVYTAVGLAVAFLASTVLMVIAFVSLRPKTTLPEHRGIEGLLRWSRWALFEHRRLVTAVSVVLFVVSAAAAWRVRADTFTIGYLPRDHPVVRDHRDLEAGWGHYSALEFTVVPAEGLRADHAEVLAGLERFVARAEERAEIRSGYGLHTVFRRMARALGADLADDEPLPPDLVAQLQLVLDMQRLEWNRDDPEYRDNFLAPLMLEDGSLGRLTLVAEMMSARELDRLLVALGELSRESMKGAAVLEPSGYPPLYVRIIEYIVTSQVRGLLVAMSVIFVMMLLWLRSWRLALLSLVPNLFPVVVLLGVMGAFGVDLDVVTATICAIVIGVSMDDTVHFLHHWRLAERDGLDWEESVVRTHAYAGKPAVVTSLLLLAGYPVLMLSGLATVFYFGLLTSIAAVAAVFGDLILLPLLLSRGRRRAAIG